MNSATKIFNLSNHLTVLDEFSKLACGWDGHCANKIDKESIVRAQWIINNIHEDLLGYISLFPMPDGNIQIECSFSKYLELEIKPECCVFTHLIEEVKHNYNYALIELLNSKFSEGYNGKVYSIEDTFHPKFHFSVVRSDDPRLGNIDSSPEVKFVEFCLWLRQHGSSVESAVVVK